MHPKQISSSSNHPTQSSAPKAVKRSGAANGKWWILALAFLSVGWGWHSLAQQRGPHIVWTSRPHQLQRGSQFVWRGKIQGASSSRLKAGLSVSVSLSQGKRDISLGRAEVGADGHFVLRGQIPPDISPRAHKLQASIWGRPSAKVPPISDKQPNDKAKPQAKQTRKAPGNNKAKAPGGKKGKKGKANGGKKPDARANGNDASGGNQKGPKGAKGGQKDPNKGAQGNQSSEKPVKPSRKSSSLWKKLREGWGPGATKDGQEQQQSRERRRQKNRFVLPPMGGLPSMPPATPKQGGQGQPGQSPPVARGARPPIGQGGNQRPDGAPGQTPGMPNMAPPPREPNRPFRNNGAQGGQDVPQMPNRGARRGDRLGAPGGMRGGRRRGGPQYAPDMQTEVPGGNQPPSRNPKGPPIMMPSRRQPPSQNRPAPPGAGGDNRLWSQANRGHLDLRTKGGHTYLRQVFTPYLPQHQRITAFDRILSDYRLAMSSTRKRRIYVGGRRNSRRSYFVGRIRVLLFPGRWTPIPSVAPDARILWYQTTPKVTLRFAKNPADIVFVRSNQQRTKSIYLEFGTDADRQYFGGPVPRGIKTSQYARRKRPRVPARIETTVRRHMHRLGLHSSMDLRSKMDKLIPYLRSFVARPLRRSEYRGNPYLTLIRARAGVCRHRAMLFTVTMRSLGYPARFVANNAHAFAEIQYPNGRWRQVDLGGGDLPHYMGNWRGPSFKPPRDPFPKPPPSARTRVPSNQRHQNNPHPPPPGTHGTGGGSHTVPPLPKPRKRKKKRRNYISHSRLF